MSSISDQLRAELTMSDVEQAQLISEGWSSIIVSELRLRGFRACQTDYVAARFGDDGSGFLRQTSLPHLHISLTKSATLDDIDSAIFDAGMQHERDMARMKWEQFFRHVTGPRASLSESLEFRIAKLEAQLSTSPSS